MSRLCVKNLPKYVKEDRLREFFSQKGEITDAKLMRTNDGKSRQFAFIGFRTEQEADEAIKYFNNSYMDSSRITCEIARTLKDPDIPRPWSRYSEKKQEKLNEGQKKSSNGIFLNALETIKKSEKSNDDSNLELQEFRQVMQPRTQSKLWANDTVGNLMDQKSKSGLRKAKSQKEDRKPSVPMQDELVEKENSFTEKENKPHNPAHNERLSDMDYFKSRVKKELSDSDSDSGLDEDTPNERQLRKDVVEDPHENLDSETNDPEDKSQPSKDQKDQILETGRLFVRNLPYTATEDDLTELFKKFSSLSAVHLVLDKGTKRSKGFAYVLYALPESAVRALDELDNSIFQGRLLHVMPAEKQKSSEKHEAIGANQASKSFKQEREERRKESEASGDTQAWNSLFMRPDTVVENIARKHGISKSDLLDREADDLAVRIALGETQVIADTKKALVNSGVNVSVLEDFVSRKHDAVERSNHVILVKNLAYGSSEDDLAKMFGKFGSIDKIIFPPTKTLALIVFLEAAEARTAFRGLAYKRYKDAPLYLEWAPSKILSSSSKSGAEAQNDVNVDDPDVKKVVLESGIEGIPDEEIDPDRVESRSLYVKNLNFKTSDEGMKGHFNENMKEGRILSVKVKKHLKNGKNVSMGFGFIEFDSVETAANVCRDLQGTILDGHALVLQVCHAKNDGQEKKKVEKAKSTTKLLVRNVAFEATEKDLRQLFSPFGQVKSLRLPMKFGNHRGYAFVEFITKQEAQNALQALSSTHLYGRHLVIERAKEGETLEELRVRTAAQFTNEQNGFQNQTKVSKKRKHIIDESSVMSQRVVD